VIQAGSIPKDTQEPDVAKGGDASRTPEQVIKEREEPARRPAARPSNAGSSSRPAPAPKEEVRKGIKVDATNDPLAGVK
jgi:hypothetical protein